MTKEAKAMEMAKLSAIADVVVERIGGLLQDREARVVVLIESGPVGGILSTMSNADEIDVLERGLERLRDKNMKILDKSRRRLGGLARG